MSLTHSEQNFSISEVVYAQHSQSQQVFVIESGFVTAATYTDDGKKRIHLVYGPGAYFPVLSMFKGTPQRAEYEALTDVSVAVFSRSQFLTLLDTDLSFCRDVLGKTVDQLALFADRVIDLQMTKLSDQLLFKLRVLAKDHGLKIGDRWVLPYKLTHHHLADMLGVERESVSRNLIKLTKSGLVQQDKSGKFSVVM